MRSLRYMLTGCPHTLDDCLDLPAAQRPTKVVLELSVDDFVSDMVVVTQFVATFRWQFSGFQVVCSEIYGCTDWTCGFREVQACVRAACERLRCRLEEIRSLEIEVTQVNRSFMDTNPFLERI